MHAPVDKCRRAPPRAHPPGLRSFVIPIARAVGALKRADPEAPEDALLYRWAFSAVPALPQHLRGC